MPPVLLTVRPMYIGPSRYVFRRRWREANLEFLQLALFLEQHRGAPKRSRRRKRQMAVEAVGCELVSGRRNCGFVRRTSGHDNLPPGPCGQTAFLATAANRYTRLPTH